MRTLSFSRDHGRREAKSSVAKRFGSGGGGGVEAILAGGMKAAVIVCAPTEATEAFRIR